MILIDANIFMYAAGKSTRDGVHLGVMKEHGIETVLSYDRNFSDVPWVQRLEA